MNPEKSNFTEGQRFARGYMKHISEILQIEFTLDDDYEDDVEDNYDRKIGDVIHRFLRANKSELKKFCESNELLLNNELKFREFCFERAYNEKFSSDYNATNFLYSMSLITAVVVYLHEKNGLNWTRPLAMRIIGDMLDFYLDIGEFESAGGYDALREVTSISWSKSIYLNLNKKRAKKNFTQYNKRGRFM